MKVSLHGGAANKNIGDAFLLVWKFPRAMVGQREFASRAQSDTDESNNPGVIPSSKSARYQTVRDLADRALAAFVIIQVRAVDWST